VGNFFIWGGGGQFSSNTEILIISSDMRGPWRLFASKETGKKREEKRQEVVGQGRNGTSDCYVVQKKNAKGRLVGKEP